MTDPTTHPEFAFVVRMAKRFSRDTIGMHLPVAPERGDDHIDDVSTRYVEVRPMESGERWIYGYRTPHAQGGTITRISVARGDISDEEAALAIAVADACSVRVVAATITAGGLLDRLTSIEMDGDYAADFRRLVSAARQRLSTAMRKHDGAWIAEVRRDALSLLEGWDVPVA